MYNATVSIIVDVNKGHNGINKYKLELSLNVINTPAILL